MPHGHGLRRCLLRTCGVALVASMALAMSPGSSEGADDGGVRVWPISYRAHNGISRAAYVVLPAWYGPDNNPVLPVVISPHGRGGSGLSNARFWGDLPAQGGFGLINAD